MGKTNNPEILSGLFEGGNFPNAQIIVLTGDGVHVSYEAYKKRDEKETNAGLRQLVMEYVNRLMPVVAPGYKEDYSQ